MNGGAGRPPVCPDSRCGLTVLPASATAAAAAAGSAAARRVGFLDLDVASLEVGVVQLADRLIGVLGRRHLDEAEAARLTRVAIGHDTGGLDGADGREGGAQALVGGGKGEAADDRKSVV